MEDFLTGKKHIHFIGIGGSGMYPLAQILHGQGFYLTGSDNNETETLDLVRKMGIPVFMGQRAENIEGADLIVHTAAIMNDNPELIAARESGVTVIERSVLLGLITSRYDNAVCICGTHGKTTASSMLTHIFLADGIDLTAVIGGKLKAIHGSGICGKSETMVCEACEFVDTFLKLYPDTSVILNIDCDHLDYFKTMDNLRLSFTKFCNLTTKRLVYNGDDDITVLKDGSDTFSCKLQLVRDEIKSRIYSVLPNEYGAVAVAMLLGDKSGVSDETLGALKGAGIYHLFAVSGLHLSIWVLGVFTFLKKLGLSNRLNSMLAVLFTFGFMALTGFTPSVSRAGIMLIVLMSGNLFGREAHSLNSLGIALFIILAANPMAAASASLLLSFGATLGIVTLYQSIDKILNRKLSSVKKKAVRRPIKAVVSVFFVSVCASLFTLPVNAAVFGEVCIIGPLTNVLVSFVSTEK